MPFGLEVTQVVVSKQLQSKLLTVAYKYPTSGHLGVKKTNDRLTRHFYWESVGKSVEQFCRIWQRHGMGSSPWRTSLIKLPIINNVFSKIAVDIVGPLTPCSVFGNRYILTEINFASHFPLAFPIKTHTVAEVV